MATLEDRYLDLLGDYELLLDRRGKLVGYANSLRQRLGLAESLLRRVGLDVGTEPESEEVQSTSSSPSEAALLAQTYLTDHLDLPDEACVDLENLDAALEARAWGQTSWEALRALHAYASELAGGRFDGSFWTWCENSRHPLVWRATSKKLSMTESDTVEKDHGLRAQRILPISRAVEPSGRLYMPAHIKIAEGGGSLAPRIYFHVSRDTGKAHVRFFGPHKYMLNTKT